MLALDVLKGAAASSPVVRRIGVALIAGTLWATSPVYAQDRTDDQERVVRAAVALAQAERVLTQVYSGTARAYDNLKAIPIPEFISSLENANREAQSLLASEAVSRALETAAKQSGARSVAKAIPFIGLAEDLPAMLRLLKLNSELIPANARANLINLLALKPVARRYEAVSNEYNAAIAAQTGRNDHGLVGISHSGLQLEGECSPNWSGPASVRVTLVQGGARSQRSAPCSGGRWSVSVQNASFPTPSVAYAVLWDGRTSASTTRAMQW